MTNQFSDPILAKLHTRVIHANGTIEPIIAAKPSDYFERLVESIVSQQLSVKVADIIFDRLKSTVGTDFSPAAIIATDHEILRSVGLSNAKASYVRNIAESWTNGLIKPENLQIMGDEDVIEHLVQIKGVGRWTAEMFLIFTLGRPDIFSAGDYGLKKAISNAYGISMESKPTVFLEIANHWQPQRSLASRILWKSLEL